MQMVNHAVASRTNMERMKQVYQQLYKFRPTQQRTENCALQNLLSSTKLQELAAVSNSSPSPTSILSLGNNSGNYLCQTSQVRTFHQSDVDYKQSHNDPMRPPLPIRSSLNSRMWTLQNHSTQIHNEPNTSRPEEFEDQTNAYKPSTMHWTSSSPIKQLEKGDTKPSPQFSYEYNKYQMDSANSEKFHQQQQQQSTQQNYELFCKTETVENNVKMVVNEEVEEAIDASNRSAKAMNMQHQQIEHESTLNMNMEMNTICNIDDTKQD
jgi:hypothetical protein